MRVKQLWSIFDLPAKLRLVWDRVTVSRTTAGYTVFSILHCLVQIVFQVQAFSINLEAANFLSRLQIQANVTDPGFPVLGKDLRMCEEVPPTVDASSCKVIWSGNSSDPGIVLNEVVSSTSLSPSATIPSTSLSSASLALSSISASAPLSSSQLSSSSIPLLPASASAVQGITLTFTYSVPVATQLAQNGDSNIVAEGFAGFEHHAKRTSLAQVKIAATNTNGSTTVTINGFGYDNDTITLDTQCLATLSYPISVLDNTKREDVVFILFQIWVLGMSIVAILNESIPHIFATLLTHIIATAWAGYKIKQTNDFRTDFARLTTDGACAPHNLLSNYWTTRADAEISSLVLNGLALVVSLVLSYRLVKLFGWQTFKRVGASLTINRLYMTVLSLSIVIQLSCFFIAVTAGLWIDQVANGSIGHLASAKPFYKAATILVVIFLFPWLALGWFAVRREQRAQMMLFLVLSILYLTGWGAMFGSYTFLWTFVEWRFFALIMSGSAFLILLVFVLGLMCRCNFGKGLPRYLSAQEPLPGDDFVSVLPNGDPEKVDFPSSEKPVPTFSAAFGSGQAVTLPSQMFSAPYQKGVRSYWSPVDETFPEAGVTVPQPARTRSPSNGSDSGVRFSPELSRQNTWDSQRSTDSNSSDASHEGYRSKKRWVIE